MKTKIEAALRRIEQESDVRILMAIESGSRAWGFASPDSDYDVRFVYVHRPDWYLSVFESRDVIEKMLPDLLDVSGWELRKALRLMAKCNVALNEWIGSPIVYSAAPGFRAAMSSMISLYFNPIGAMHHYRRMAESALESNLHGSRIKIKKLFYVLRPLLACLWIENTRTQPPTEFAQLLIPEWGDALDRTWIAELQNTKAIAAEAEEIELPTPRVEALLALLLHFKTAGNSVEPAATVATESLNDLLRTWTREQPTRT